MQELERSDGNRDTFTSNYDQMSQENMRLKLKSAPV